MEAKPMPPLSPCSKWKDQISCPICLQIKIDAMVTHELCRRLFCADCVIQAFDSRNDNCGLCRGLLLDPTSFEGLTLFSRITPNDTWMLDNLEFACQDCKIIVPYDQAKVYLNKCEKKPVFKPPEVIHDWDNVDLSIRPTVSNPVIGEPSTKRDRLLVYQPLQWQADRLALHQRQLGHSPSEAADLQDHRHRCQ